MLLAAATLWALVSAWFLFPLAKVPRFMRRAAVALLASELVALLTWSYESESCRQQPCTAVAEAARTAASTDIPALTAVLLALALVHAFRRSLRVATRVRRARRPLP